MKRCFKCARVLPPEDFYAHPQMGDGLLGKCKECTKSDVSKNYRARREQYQEYERGRNLEPERKLFKAESQRKARRRHPEKNRARAIVARMVRSGRLPRLPCARCGSSTVDAHHPDYARPLDVVWLCREHHARLHNEGF